MKWKVKSTMKYLNTFLYISKGKLHNIGKKSKRVNFCQRINLAHKILVQQIAFHKSYKAQAVAHGFIQEQVDHKKPSYQMTRNHNCLLIPLFHQSLNT